MNSFFLTGTIKKFGFRDSNYPSLWVLFQLDPYKYQGSQIDNNTLFVNFNIDNNTSTKKGRVTSYIRNNIQEGSFAYVEDATLGLTSKKVGTEYVKVPGVNASITNMNLATNRFPIINNGYLAGKIINYSQNKAVLQQTYKVPGPKAETRTRDLHVLFATDPQEDLTNKYVTLFGSLTGKTPSGQDNTIMVVSEFIIK